MERALCPHVTRHEKPFRARICSDGPRDHIGDMRIWAVVVAAVLGLAISAPVHAQEDDRPLRAFLTAGGGLGSHGTLLASLSLSHRTGDYLVRAALGFDPDVTITGVGSDGGWTREVTEYAVLYGRPWERSWGWVRGALGVGYLDSERVDPVAPGEEPPSSTAVGLAAQAGVVWAPSRALGVGLTGVANFNDVNSLAALTLSVHIGRVR